MGPENVKTHKGCPSRGDEEPSKKKKQPLSIALGSGGRWAAEFWVPVGSSDSASLPESPVSNFPQCPKCQGSVGSEQMLGGLLYFLATCPPHFTFPNPLCFLFVSPLPWLPTGFHFFFTSFGAPAASEMSPFSRRATGSWSPVDLPPPLPLPLVFLSSLVFCIDHFPISMPLLQSPLKVSSFLNIILFILPSSSLILVCSPTLKCLFF